MSSKKRKYNLKSDRQKPPESETVLNKNLYIIVNSKHRPVYHMDGHMLIFSIKKQARRWLLNNAAENLDWRVEKLTVILLR